MTTVVEAARILARLDPYRKFVAQATAAELRQRAEDFAATLAHTPDGWASAWLGAELAAGRVPNLIDFPVAWRAHVAAVAIPLLETVPKAPPGVDGGGSRWVAWERARRTALFSGASAADAVAAADAAVGATRPANSDNVKLGPDEALAKLRAVLAQTRAAESEDAEGDAR